MATPTIAIDQTPLSAGSPGVSRDDLVLSVPVVCTDPANGAGLYTWELVVPSGSSSTLSGETTATATFTPDVRGTYLLYLIFDGEKSYTENSDSLKVTTQGGAGVKHRQGTRALGTGETFQFHSTAGYADTFHPYFATIDAVNLAKGAPEGTLFYSDSDGDLARLAPGTAGYLLRTEGAAPPTWLNPTSLGDSLQSSYDNGSSIDTDAGSAVAISRTASDTGNVLSLTKNPGSAFAGSALMLIMGSQATGPALDIANSGNGPDVLWGASRLQGGSVFLEEKGAALADLAGLGQVWAKPSSELWFTGPDGVDVRLGIGVPASAIELARVAGSTFFSLQHLQDVFHSTGWISGGVIADDADGTITVSEGTGAIRGTNSSTAQLLFFDWAAESGVNVNLTDNAINFVYVEYNAGSPRVKVSATERADVQTNLLLGTVYRIGTTLHRAESNKQEVGDHAEKMVRRSRAVAPFVREDGGSIGEIGTRNISVSAGTWWHGLTNFSTSELDTSAAGTFDYHYQDGSGGFTTVTAQTQIDNLQYDDGSGGLATLANNRYGVHWAFVEQDSEYSVVYGRDSYTLLEAKNASIPANLPPQYQEDHGRLIGKIIVGKSDAALFSVESSFAAAFEQASPTDHASLLNLTSPTAHTQLLLIDGTVAMTGALLGTAGTESLPGVAVGAVGDGMWSPGAGQVAFSTAGTEALRLDASQNTLLAGGLFLTERAAGEVDQAGYGQIWTKTDNTLWFTDEAGVDTELTGGGGGGGLTALSVANIDDPSTELNAIAGAAKGDTRLVYQTVAGKDQWAIYAWDDADSSGEAVPATVDGSSGMWSAIGGKYNSGGIIAAADTDATFIFGRTVIHSSNSDFVRISHFDHQGNTSYALGISPAGQVGINAPAGRLLHLRIADSTQFILNTSSFAANNANGPALLKEAASDVNPTFVPNKSSLNTGMGANAAGEVSIITGATEAVRWDASQNQINAAGIFLNVGTPSNPILAIGDTTTGLWGAGGTQISVTIGGVNAANLTDNQIFYTPGGVTSPAYSFMTNTQTGLGSSVTGRLELVCQAVTTMFLDKNKVLISPQAISGGAHQRTLEVTAPANIGITNPTTYIDTQFDLSLTCTFASGATIPRAYGLDITARTFASASATVITDAATLRVSAAPIEGTLVTIDNPMALWVESGATKLGGDLIVADTINADGQIGSNQVPLTDEATIETNCNLGNGFTVTLTANRTLGLPTNPRSGHTYTWRIVQNGGGGNTLAYASEFHFSGGDPVLTTTAGAIDLISAYYDGSNFLCAFLPDIKA